MRIISASPRGVKRKMLCICCHLMNKLRRDHAVSPQPNCLERHAPPGLNEPYNITVTAASGRNPDRIPQRESSRISERSTVRFERRQDGCEVFFVRVPARHRPAIDRTSHILVSWRIKLLAAALFVKAPLAL